MLLMPSGPSRLTACFTRSVRPQLSIRKPRSCRNFASVEVASSLLEAQTQSSVLKGKAQDSRCRQGGFGLLAKPHVFPDHLTCFHSHQRKKENHFSYLLLIFLACVLVHTSARRYFLFPDEVVGSPNTNAHTHTHTHTLQPKGDTLLTAIPELARLTVHSGQQQPGSLPHVIAVHREAASVLSVNHGHAHPLHQRRQHHERPTGGDRSTRTSDSY